MKVRDIMTKDLVRVEPSATIAWVISKGDNLVGIASLFDVLKAF